MNVILSVHGGVELEPHFEAWEKSFHVHPCQAYQGGEFPCGHMSDFVAHARCTGCDEEINEVYFCAHHRAAYESGLVAMHLNPCGYSGFLIMLTNIHEVE